MKYSPTKSELETFTDISSDERLSYCLTRICESEEVWGLAEPQGWVISEADEAVSLPIWPYREFAQMCIKDEWQNAEPQAISLEHFVYKVSQMLIENDMMVEVFTTPQSPGQRLEAKAFFKILENMMESGEYFMEG